MLIRRNVVLGWAAPFCIAVLFLLGPEINAFGQEKAALSPSKPIPTELSMPTKSTISIK